MLKSKTFGWLFIILALAILAIGFYAIGNLIIIKYFGKKVIATVTAVPQECDKYNHINVLLDGATHEVSINKSECREGTYQVGQKVELMQHPGYKDLVWPESKPELAVLLILLVLGYLFFEYKRQTRKNLTKVKRQT